MRLRVNAVATVMAVGIVSACSTKSSAPPAPAPAETAPRRTPRAVAVDRNITRADYIGPTACGECHEAQHGLWSASLHRVMNASASEPGAVIGDFADARISYRGGVVEMAHDSAGYTMTAIQGQQRVRYRVTRTIGRQGLQEYVGVEDGAGQTTEVTEVRLPLGFWPRHGGWAVQPAFDPWLDEKAFDPFKPVREPWADRCPWCHSTYPFEQRIARASGPRAVGHGLEQFYASRSPGTGTLALDEQVTTGISCESCHLGGRAHAEGAPIQFLPRGADARSDGPILPTTFATQRTDATVINAVCGQCHSGPSPRLADGTALRNSSEALDLAASPCVGIKCTDCHDPHRADGRPDETRSVAVCTSCHATQSAPMHAGTGHGTTTCLDCHMPRMVMGIDRYVRTHRISSPTDARLIAEAAPNACNLCHLDRSIDWTLTELRAGWSAGPLRPRVTAYGDDHERSVGDIWLSSASPSIRLIAAHAYARSPLGPYVRKQLEAGLTDRVAYVRAWMKLALDELAERTSGRR